MNDFISESLHDVIGRMALQIGDFVYDKQPLGPKEAEIRLEAWCRNFAPFLASCTALEEMVQKLEFIPDRRVLKDCLKHLRTYTLQSAGRPVYACLGETSESSSRIMGLMKGDDDFAEHIVAAVDRCRQGKADTIVTIDDFLNTGNQFSQILRQLFREATVAPDASRTALSETHISFLRDRQTQFQFCFFRGTEIGRKKANDELRSLGLNGEVVVIEQYSDDHGIFGSREDIECLEQKPNDWERRDSAKRSIFQRTPLEEVSQFLRICRTAGEQLGRAAKPDWPNCKVANRALGYGNSAQLFITQKNVPACTLTCLWRVGRVQIDGVSVDWTPLVERREKTIGGSEGDALAGDLVSMAGQVAKRCMREIQIVTSLEGFTFGDEEILWFRGIKADSAGSVHFATPGSPVSDEAPPGIQPIRLLPPANHAAKLPCEIMDAVLLGNRLAVFEVDGADPASIGWTYSAGRELDARAANRPGAEGACQNRVCPVPVGRFCGNRKTGGPRLAWRERFESAEGDFFCGELQYMERLRTVLVEFERDVPYEGLFDNDGIKAQQLLFLTVMPYTFLWQRTGDEPGFRVQRIHELDSRLADAYRKLQKRLDQEIIQPLNLKYEAALRVITDNIFDDQDVASAVINLYAWHTTLFKKVFGCELVPSLYRPVSEEFAPVVDEVINRFPFDWRGDEGPQGYGHIFLPIGARLAAQQDWNFSRGDYCRERVLDCREACTARNERCVALDHVSTARDCGLIQEIVVALKTTPDGFLTSLALRLGDGWGLVVPKGTTEPQIKSWAQRLVRPPAPVTTTIAPTQAPAALPVTKALAPASITAEDIERGRRDKTWVEERLKKLSADNPMVGEADALLPVYTALREIAEDRDRLSPVWVHGEPGTGKELIAQLIHDLSNIKKELVKVNAAAVPEMLAASELFGHIKGSASGFDSEMQGAFARAAGSTIFLDSMEALAITTQTVLLRAVDPTTRSYCRVGEQGNDQRTTCRVVCSCNQPEQKLKDEGRLRSDLLDRFKHRISIPPLRDRQSDIPAIVAYYVDAILREWQVPETEWVTLKQRLRLEEVSVVFRGELRGEPGPANIRGLRARVEKTVEQKLRDLDDRGELPTEKRPADMSCAEFAAHLRRLQSEGPTVSLGTMRNKLKADDIIDFFEKRAPGAPIGPSEAVALCSSLRYNHPDNLKKALQRLLGASHPDWQRRFAEALLERLAVR